MKPTFLLLVFCCCIATNLTAQKFATNYLLKDHLAPNSETRITRRPQKGAPMVGLNYIGHFPGLPIGIAFPVFFKNSTLGIYGDFKGNFSNNGPEGADMSDSLTQFEIENYLKHPFLGNRESSPFIFNLGVTIKSKTEGLVYYAAIGAVVKSYYKQYFDPSGQWSRQGNYYILYKRERKLNVTGGAMYIFKNGLIVQGGFDTTPFGLNLGIGIVFSRYPRSIASK